MVPFLDRDEHDACGIVAWIEKSALATRDNVEHVLRALDQMRHRAGFVAMEGDGSGILMDLPKGIWADFLQKASLDPELVYQNDFVVAHIMVTNTMAMPIEKLQSQFSSFVQTYGFTLLLDRVDEIDHHALGPGGQAEGIHFYQAALQANMIDKSQVAKACYELHLAIERQLAVHTVSVSPETVVYKVRGDSFTLRKFYHDFSHPEFKSRMTLGHNRYSTNTTTSSERVQPFTLLGHNGELNTIHRLREESRMLSIEPVPGGSDSQDLNRFLDGLIHRYGYSLAEAMELAFPPIIHEIKQMKPDMQDLYMFMRSLWGPFSQGPAGIVSRYAQEAVFSVDALGLRPLWMVETMSSLVFSSEQGVVAVADMVADPMPLAPGEKIYVELKASLPTLVYSYRQMQDKILETMSNRYAMNGFRHSLLGKRPAVWGDVHLTPNRTVDGSREVRQTVFGWDSDDIRVLEWQATQGAEPIRSLGFDGPLAIFSPHQQNVSDFLKETVAVVTNPAIDREREIEHFSTRVILGPRPSVSQSSMALKHLELPSPILLGGHSVEEPDRYRALAQKTGSQLFEDVVRYFAQSPEQVAEIDPRLLADETLEQALDRLKNEVVEAVQNQATLIVLDDRFSFDDGSTFIDPALAVSAAHRALRAITVDGENGRRRSSIIVRTAAVRNLHDLAVLVGLGADAVCPYLYLETAFAYDNWKGIENVLSALTKGLEKVLSTLGIHELRGYDRLFSAIGLSTQVAEFLEIKSFFDTSSTVGSFAAFAASARERRRLLQSDKPLAIRPYQLWPRIWKSAGDAAAGAGPYKQFSDKLFDLEKSQPISLRHVLDFVVSENAPQKSEEINLTIGEHQLPFVISSMSFGSQSESAFRSYALAAQQLDMISLNGEGGEIKDMLGQFAKNRGHQIASGRFGVNAELCNSVDLLEIKIGQGAKPGEGGHLPGSKVSLKVANARNARQGTDLISPSNNHDIYSIEDLAQMIDELKTVNPRAKVSVKVPVVPGIGTIAIGIAKAGADVIALSGYDGGTGAARAHALKHVGLPIEIGVKLAHEALLEAGLRESVEIWADGGMKTGRDVVKLTLLGANRTGFGTMAMIAIGCTGCRGCHKDTCHVGIATQIETQEQAVLHGLKAFVPRDVQVATANLVRFFKGLAEETKDIVASLGAESLQELVGRSDLLVQTSWLDTIDLSDLCKRHVDVRYGFQVQPARKSSVGDESLTVALGEQAIMAMAAGNESISYGATAIDSCERVIGGMLSGSVVRHELRDKRKGLKRASIQLTQGSVVGNGFAAYNAMGVQLRVEGGAQDGVGKSSLGGKVVVLKGLNRFGQRVNGSVGKGLAYGAQRGLFIVQGDADSRAGIRLSGADLILGGTPRDKIDPSKAALASVANIKGFAFEYMTGGRALVLGDPGPWICSGMTGGVVYLRLQPEIGLTVEALHRRLAKGAKVTLTHLNAGGILDVQELLALYRKELERSSQEDEADRLLPLWEAPDDHFMMVRAAGEQTNQDEATE